MPSVRYAEALDHLLIGAPSLESGVSWLEARTGVRAIPGGAHPGLGTWNALASLGPARYIEIIAPDPAQPDAHTFYVPGLRDFDAPRIVTWAAKGSNLEQAFMSSLPDDIFCAPPRQGRRLRPDGTELAWTLVFPKHRTHGVFDGALPFLIEWKTSINHPGSTAPAGLILRGLSFSHPEPEELKHALGALGIDSQVERADSTSIRVELDTPRGVIVLTT